MRHISNYVETDIFREIYAPAKISPDTAPHGIAESHSTERFAQIREKEWWAPRESNPAPTDYESAALTKHEQEAQRAASRMNN